MIFGLHYIVLVLLSECSNPADTDAFNTLLKGVPPVMYECKDKLTF